MNTFSKKMEIQRRIWTNISKFCAVHDYLEDYKLGLIPGKEAFIIFWVRGGGARNENRTSKTPAVD